MCNIWINIFVPVDLQDLAFISLSERARCTVQGLPAALLPRLLKSALGYTVKDARAILGYLYTILCLSLPPPLSVLVAAAG